MTDEEIKTLQETVANLQKENEGLKAVKAAPAPAPKEEPAPADDLLAKAKAEKAQQEKGSSDIKRLESNLRFNMTLPDFVKSNRDLLPSDVEGVLKVAEKENYDTVIDKANAVKVGIITAFFAQQSNLELLTPSQKTQFEDFQKLTKNGRDDKAEHIYENIFEPALETLRKVKKAEELGKARNGFATANSVEEEYKERLMKLSRKTYLKETSA